MTRNQAETVAALETLLDELPNVVGLVLLVVRPKPGAADPSDMEVEVGSAFQGRELKHGELLDLLRTAMGIEERVQ